jgi:phosphatidate cytidylyltransferase
MVGSKFGKHLVDSKISPKKTWEGVAGGIAATIGISIIIGTQFPVMHLHQWIITGFITSLTGTLGDLAESSIKRNLKVKDSGNFIPGHGGILDRIDSILFAVPSVVFYLLISGI